jgi:hypothetical protein
MEASLMKDANILEELSEKVWLKMIIREKEGPLDFRADPGNTSRVGTVLSD